MNEYTIKCWLADQVKSLDRIIADACNDFWQAHRNLDNFDHDFAEAQNESWKLSKGLDLCYDRYASPLAYSLWYHPRRVNTFLTSFVDDILKWSGQDICVFDLGAGTGAVQWAFVLTAVAMRECGCEPPRLRIVNVDTSPFMLLFSRDYLWKRFIEQIDVGDLKLSVEFEVNSWTNVAENVSPSNTIIASSYLFDSSDEPDQIVSSLVEIVKTYDPRFVMALTSQNKSENLRNLSQVFHNLGYTSNYQPCQRFLLRGNLDETNRLRDRLAKSYPRVKFGQNATWFDPSVAKLLQTRQQTRLDFETSQAINSISIFNPPLKLITEIKLSDAQQKASEYSPRPSVIVGPAGSGKSIVICEKVLSTADYHRFDPNLKILITTFNKPLVRRLADWLEDLLSVHNVRRSNNRETYAFRFDNSNIDNITLLNFDKLPTRIGSIEFAKDISQDKNQALMKTICEDVTKELAKSEFKQLQPILDPEFLLTEYQRVIYGLEIGVKEGKSAYMTVDRTGRGATPRMQKNSRRREVVFKVLKRYIKDRYNKGQPRCFIVGRQYFHYQLKDFSKERKYDYIFVDELQDCSQADYRIFTLLLKDPNYLCIAGDLAQAVHIGMSAKIPRFEEMSNRIFHRLASSYRLPVRISEAIRPLSEEIQRIREDDDVDLVSPHKTSPPGSRPIVVHADSPQAMAKKINEILEIYSEFRPESPVILEKDQTFSARLTEIGIRNETSSVLKLKGMEKRCVIWSTRVDIKSANEQLEFVYTILSRTSSLLIIALWNELSESTESVIRLLRADRLIMWDEASKNRYASIQSRNFDE